MGLTGGIGTGKSFCLAKFAELGAPTIDADGLARQAAAPGTAGYQRIVARFGSAILKADGSLDRAALGALVFSDADARHALEGIIHPVVYAAIERWFDGHSRTGHVEVAIADIPLLFETRREADVDRVVVAYCPVAIQKARVMARDGWSETEADQRIASQISIEEKAARADHVIDTSGTFEETTRQVRDVWTKLRDAASQPR